MHRYRTRLTWVGSTGVGYDHYERAHRVEVLGPDGTVVEPTLDGAGLRLSADAAFHGDPTLLNSEQLLVMAASTCQLLSFLAVAARARIDVVSCVDEAIGEMPDDGDALTLIELHPAISVRGEVAEDRLLHFIELAHKQCYIANSLRTEVRVRPTWS